MSLVKTPAPPYWVVVFTAEETAELAGMEDTGNQMVALAEKQPGFLGMEFAGSGGLSVTLSYWATPESISNWKQQVDHLEAQRQGREKWYQRYQIRVAKVERDYRFEK